MGPDLTRLIDTVVNPRYSLIGNNPGAAWAMRCRIARANGNLIGPRRMINPQLGPLAGQRRTDADAGTVGECSPAMDAGDAGAASGVGTVPEFDQRGTPFVRVFGGTN